MAIKSKKNNKRKYMIKILIMDDSRPKTEAIKRYLTDDCLLPSDNIDTAITINEWTVSY